jgi:16S rRNA processing protein RimM
VLARVRRVRGIRGEVLLGDLGTAPQRFQPGLRVFLVRGESSEWVRSVEVERTWLHGPELVVKFGGIDTRTEAEAFQGCEVRIPLEERPAAPEGEYYLSDLVGCRVFSRDGRYIGEVTSWQEPGGTPLLEVRGTREVLIPFVSAICVDIDPADRRITVELPEGLEELNP